jgi:hypothetical protein
MGVPALFTVLAEMTLALRCTAFLDGEWRGQLGDFAQFRNALSRSSRSMCARSRVHLQSVERREREKAVREHSQDDESTAQLVWLRV